MKPIVVILAAAGLALLVAVDISAQNPTIMRWHCGVAYSDSGYRHSRRVEFGASAEWLKARLPPWPRSTTPIRGDERQQLPRQMKPRDPDIA
jgi:hypothetical protein